MTKIVTLTVIDEEGRTTTWTGMGQYDIVKTQTPIKDVPPNLWPELTYITARLVPK